MLEPNIDINATLDPSCQVWGNATVRAGASIGARTIIGTGVYIDSGVVVGSDCKIQNSAQVYFPAKIENGVFIGPLVTLTNDKNPRAVNINGAIKQSSDWSPVGVLVESGASIGAGAVCVAPVCIGRWAMVAAGSVVIDEVKAHQLVGGNPAKHLGWVGRSGHKLVEIKENEWGDSLTGEKYFLDSDGQLTLWEKND